MDIKAILISARNAVDEAEIPQDLRPMAFSKAIDLLAAPIQTAATPSPHGQAAIPGQILSPQQGDSSLGRLAAKLRIDLDTVKEVFDQNGDDIDLIVPAMKIDAGKRAGTRQIALLVAAGRQGSGKEEWTPVAAIRSTVSDFKRLDSANYSATIREMSDIFGFRGKSSNLEVKISRPGWETAAALVGVLGGGGA